MDVDIAATLKEAGQAEAEPTPDVEEEEEEQPRLISVGVMDIDKKLGGGLQPDTLTLVEGDPDSGKSVVIQQLTYGALRERFRAALYLSETNIRDFLGQMDTLGMSTMDYLLLGRLAAYQANLRVDKEKAEMLLSRLLKHVEKSDGRELFIVDSITSLLFQFDERFVLSFLAACKDLADKGRTIMVTLHSYAITESLRLRASSICDAHLRLRIEEMGKQLVRTLEVCKIRGAVKTVDNSVSFSVEPGLGLKSIPISKAKA
jgi:flagellar protein FlaH